MIGWWLAKQTARQTGAVRPLLLDGRFFAQILQFLVFDSAQQQGGLRTVRVDAAGAVDEGLRGIEAALGQCLFRIAQKGGGQLAVVCGGGRRHLDHRRGRCYCRRRRWRHYLLACHDGGGDGAVQ